MAVLANGEAAMTAAITLAFVVFGLACLFWSITATDARPARRVTAAGTGIFALLIAALLGVTHDGEDRS
jgi:hypothetical protein